jgi:hypothetical protein
LVRPAWLERSRIVVGTSASLKPCSAAEIISSEA